MVKRIPFVDRLDEDDRQDIMNEVRQIIKETIKVQTNWGSNLGAATLRMFEDTCDYVTIQ